MHYPVIGPFVAYLFVLVALHHAAKTCWVTYKGETGRTPHLAMACVCTGMILFLTVVPGVMVLATPHYSTPFQALSTGDF